MLYALAFDKFVFGQTPGTMSIIGSTLILGSAVYMSVHRNGSSSSKEAEQVRDPDGRAGGDEEEMVGLMGASEIGEEGVEVEMRDLR